MRILVTGGAGFIGSHVAEALLARGHEIAVLDNLRTGRREHVPEAATFYEADVTEPAALARVFAEFAPQAVCHQAAQTSVAVSVREPVEDARINVLGGLHLLQACVAHGTRHLVFASTGGAIYGEIPEGQRATTAWPAKPASPYAAAKLACEHYLGVYAAQHGLRVQSLRYANVYGPRQDPHGEAGVVAIFANALRTGRAVTVFARRELGDAGCVRDYVYVADVIRANVAALDGKLTERVVNVATGVGTTTRALFTEMCALAGREVPVEANAPRPGDLQVSVLEPSSTLVQEQAPTSLTSGLQETLTWFGVTPSNA